MKSKYRLLSSVALAAVVSSFAHAQAYGTSSTAASINITGAYSRYGGYAVGGIYTASLGYYYGFIGPVHGNSGQYAGGTGHYSFYNHVGWGFNGEYGSAFGQNYASPNGQVISGGYTGNTVDIINTNAIGVYVTFGGSTGSYSYAFQRGAGDSAYSEGFAELIFNGYLVFQESSSVVEADNLFGVGNYTETYNYQLGVGGSGASYFYGYGSPFTAYAFTGEYNAWRLYLPAYSSATITEFNEVIGAATSSRANGTPGPAAVAPFAMGLLAALRRRNKKS